MTPVRGSTDLETQTRRNMTTRIWILLLKLRIGKKILITITRNWMIQNLLDMKSQFQISQTFV